ncbi:hypothetical protein L9H26_12075 [Morganella psychrotolerans]|uniref:Tetratricopeptide repeat protein n=1 Tax=Morganella psychrotolerans TaxID=368603 RepID=A0A5M9R4N7_9GAMM|nr:hypothetical protein [Morganella psychrotolerans]KAA8715491.1 hypothetical protein F4V73_11010 [Morganella psychrotolerans]OBU05531.1 hypothetical protein AYY16_09835 [Morganella psychrotolerans]
MTFIQNPVGYGLNLSMSYHATIVITYADRVPVWSFRPGLALTDIQALASVPEIALITQYERVEFDLNLNRLMRYNQTRDPKLLEYYRLWAEEYLDKHTDQNVYFSLVMILHHQGNIIDEQKYLSRARELFPQENKFVR